MAHETKENTGNIVARDLMKVSYLRLGAEHTLREIMGILLDPRSKRQEPRAIVLIKPTGELAGILTVRFLLQGLLPDWIEEGGERENEEAFEHRLLGAMQERLDRCVSEVMVTDMPTAALDDRLPRLIDYMHDKRMDCLPVVDNGRVKGIIYLTDLFNAAATLALTAQAEAAKPS